MAKRPKDIDDILSAYPETEDAPRRSKDHPADIQEILKLYPTEEAPGESGPITRVRAALDADAASLRGGKYVEPGTENTDIEPRNPGTIPAAMGRGFTEGFGPVSAANPIGLSEQQAQTLRDAGVYGTNPLQRFNEAIINPLAAGAGLAIRTGAGGMRALQEGLMQAGREGIVNPLLARDVAALPEAFPTMGAFAPHVAAVRPVNPLEAPKFISERFAPAPVAGQTPLERITQLLRHDDAEASGTSPASLASPPSVRPVIPRPEVGVPGSVGASASREGTAPGLIAEVTPAQKATALQKMVNQSAEERLTPAGRDDATYFPGVVRPEAMKDFSSAPEGGQSIAMQHKVLYNTDTAYHDQFDAQVKRNNNVMVDTLHDMFGDANIRDAAMNEAKELMPGAIDLFAGEKPVNAEPIAVRISSILSGPAGKRGAVRSQLNTILSNLKDADGNLESMPSMLKGIRDDITDKLYDKSPTVEGNAARTARNQLQDVLSVVDETIAKGLPGTKYQDYLANLSAALGKVSKLDYMQQFLTGPKKLTDQAGNLQLSKVNRMLDDIQKRHADKTGGAKEMTMQEINLIEAARNELAAKDLLDRRAAVRGSPTAQLQNASGILGSGPLGAGVRGAAEAAAHAGLAATTGGAGNALLGGYKYIVKPAVQAARDRAAANALAATRSRLLSTDRSPLAHD